MFNLPEFLTKRDAWAGTFESVFSYRTTPRTDCPTVLPTPPQLGLRRNVHEQSLNDLQLWFIEGNSKPALIPYSKDRKKILKSLIQDMFEINFGILRSRAKRIIVLMNEIAQENASQTLIPVEVYEIAEKYQDKFKDAIKNRYEPEFRPSTKNSFRLIIDENLEGPSRYANLIDEICL